MNLFVKKLLAKYVKYIEIVGFLFVILFIAGLVALSQIKAEDEFVSLHGILEIEKEIFLFPKRQVILNIFTDSSRPVKSGEVVFELTNSKKYISDQEIIKNLEEQIKSAQEVSNNILVHKFSTILSEMKTKTYSNLEIKKISSTVSGDFFPSVSKNEITEINQTIGGIFNFNNSVIKVSDFPADKQQKKKLKVGQTGTATLNLGVGNSVSIPVEMVELNEKNLIFNPEDLTFENKQKIAAFFDKGGGEKVAVNLSVLVGSKSWMNLIWR